MYFSGLYLAMACPCQPQCCNDAHCREDQECIPGNVCRLRVTIHEFDKRRSKLPIDADQIDEIELDSFASGPSGFRSRWNPLGRFNGKRCSSQKDCEWHESCITQYGICWGTWPRLQ